MVKTIVSSAGEITIPRDVLDQLQLVDGTQVSLEVQGESLVVRRVAEDRSDWRTMQGMVRDGPSLTKGLEEDRAWEQDHDERIGKSS
jgi:antitoxin component of MazEF toxin-antitoxin module